MKSTKPNINKDAFFLEVIRKGEWSIDRATSQVTNNITGNVLGSNSKSKIPTFIYSNDGQNVAITKSRLLWVAFKGLIPEGYVISQIDKKETLHIDNLECITDMEHRQKNNNNMGNRNKVYGEANNFAIFKDAEVIKLRLEYARQSFSLRKRAIQLKTTHQTLSELISGKTYSHLPYAIPIVRNNIKKIDRQSKEWLDSEKERKRLYARRIRASNSPKPQTVKPKTISQAIEPKPILAPLVKAPVVKTVNKEIVVKVRAPSFSQFSVEKNRLHRETRELEKIKREQELDRREFERAKLEKARLNRLLLIRNAAEKINNKNKPNLTPFKQFAVYHLVKLGWTMENVIRRLSINENDYHQAIKSFPSEQYNLKRSEFIKRLGRDSNILAKIHIFEGNSND